MILKIKSDNILPGLFKNLKGGQAVPDGFEIQALSPWRPETPKGSRTWEWLLPDGRQITVYKRLSKEEAGSHFHKGEDPAKNPELFLLTSGEIIFEFVDSKGAHFTKRLSAKNGPVELIIHPYVLHRATPLTKCSFIEYRTTRFNPEKPDTWEPKHFPVKTDW